MAVRREGNLIRLEGDCPVEEAEALAALLESGTDWTVDLSLCRHAHGAVVQALLRFGPALRGTPESPFMRDRVLPALLAAGVQAKDYRI